MARIFFAGAEKVDTLRELVTNGVRHVLFSYFYMQKRGQLDALFQLLDDYPDTRVLVDSGAYSFRANWRRIHDVTPQSYYDGYRNFIREFGHRFTYAVELDLDGIGEVSDDTIRGWREGLIDLGTVPIVPVWHPNRGMSSWEEWCHDPRIPHLGLAF